MHSAPGWAKEQDGEFERDLTGTILGSCLDTVQLCRQRSPDWRTCSDGRCSGERRSLPNLLDDATLVCGDFGPELDSWENKMVHLLKTNYNEW